MQSNIGIELEGYSLRERGAECLRLIAILKKAVTYTVPNVLEPEVKIGPMWADEHRKYEDNWDLYLRKHVLAARATGAHVDMFWFFANGAEDVTPEYRAQARKNADLEEFRWKRKEQEALIETWPKEVQSAIAHYRECNGNGAGAFMGMIILGLCGLFIPTPWLAVPAFIGCFACIIPAAKGKTEYEAAKSKLNKLLSKHNLVYDRFLH